MCMHSVCWQQRLVSDTRNEAQGEALTQRRSLRMARASLGNSLIYSHDSMGSAVSCSTKAEISYPRPGCQGPRKCDITSVSHPKPASHAPVCYLTINSSTNSRNMPEGLEHAAHTECVLYLSHMYEQLTNMCPCPCISANPTKPSY